MPTIDPANMEKVEAVELEWERQGDAEHSFHDMKSADNV